MNTTEDIVGIVLSMSITVGPGCGLFCWTVLGVSLIVRGLSGVFGTSCVCGVPGLSGVFGWGRLRGLWYLMSSHFFGHLTDVAGCFLEQFMHLVRRCLYGVLFPQPLTGQRWS